MGYDPFWPICLATVNVLVVPAGPIPPRRFDDLFQALSKVKSIPLSDINLDGIENEAFFSADTQTGSLLFNSSKSPHQSSVQRFPFEINADPQIVLGIYDASVSGNDQTVLLQSAVSKFQSHFQNVNPHVTAVVLGLGLDTASYPQGLMRLTPEDEGGVYSALTRVARLFVDNVIDLESALASGRLENPRDVLAVHNNETSRSSHETNKASLPDQVQPGQSSTLPPQVTIQNTSRHKGRYTISLGFLNLLVGSWQDATRRLSEGAAFASGSGDKLWHARAVEGLLICMTLQVWQGTEFTVPELFEPSKAYTASVASQRSRSSSITARITAVAHRADATKLKPLERWVQLAPFVSNLGLELYLASQAWDVPQIIITEARFRLINILAFCQAGRITGEHLDAFILSQQQPVSHGPALARSSDPSLANMVVDIALSAGSAQSPSDTIAVLAAAVSSLASLGSTRKHAFLFRSLLLKLAPALVKARRLGASEAGIHSAAALPPTAATSSSEEGTTFTQLRSLLVAAAAASNIYLPDFADTSHINTLSRTASRLRSWVHQQSTGDLSLKLELLQACIVVCDAMPDMQASLAFTSELLGLSIRSRTISNTQTNPRPWLSPEDQAHYADHVKRAAAAALKLGLERVRAIYWDDWLVRDVQLCLPPNASSLTSHQPSELSLVQNAVADGPQDPFIFNPFAKTVSANTTPIVVAGEPITFSVLLQNPLEVDIDVPDISLLTEGCDFEATHHSIILGPFCAQIYMLTGVPRTNGSLKVTGCRATVDGCHEQDFPIYRDQWLSPIQIKVKPQTVKSQAAEGAEVPIDLKLPDASTVRLRVIDPTPQLQLESPDLVQPSVMLLEGEKVSCHFTVKNTSASIPVDLLLFSSNDNVSTSLQETLRRKDLSPADTYEIQYQLKNRQTLRISTKDDPAELPPGGARRYHFDIFGRAGLSTAALQVNFAHLGKPRSDINETFYTRHTTFPISVTVNGSIEVQRCTVLPVADDFQFHSDHSSNSVKAVPSQNGYCVISLDLCNIWPHPLSVRLTSSSASDDEGEEPKGENNEFTFESTLAPGQPTRCILLMPRFFLSSPLPPIPNLLPSTNRQFVVSSASKLSAEDELISRETFWYREEVLKRLKGEWWEWADKRTRRETDLRKGKIDLRKGISLARFALGGRMVEGLRVESVDIDFELKADDSGDDDRAVVKTLRKSHFRLPIESFATLHVRVHNRSSDRLSLLLRLQPSLKDQPHAVALDLWRRFSWSGLLQQGLHPVLEPGDVREAKLGIVVLSKGAYEVSASVEERKRKQRERDAAVIGSGAAVDSSAVSQNGDTNILMIVPQPKDSQLKIKQNGGEQPKKVSGKKAKRLEKYIEKKMKKDEAMGYLRLLEGEETERQAQEGHQEDSFVESVKLGKRKRDEKEGQKKPSQKVVVVENGTEEGGNESEDEWEAEHPEVFKDEIQNPGQIGGHSAQQLPRTLVQQGIGLAQPIQFGPDGLPIIETRRKVKKKRRLFDENQKQDEPAESEDEDEDEELWEGFSNDGESHDPGQPVDKIALIKALVQDIEDFGSSDEATYAVHISRSPEIEASRASLPILAREQEVMEAIHNHDFVIVTGSTGSGKTTQLPQFLYEAGYGSKDGPTPGMIGITQPRRIAATSMAERVAVEMGDRGSQVGYQIRYESKVGPNTAIKFMTDGILMRELQEDLLLKRYSALVIDEAHERSVNTDVLIGILSKLVPARLKKSRWNPEPKPLKVVVMSATLHIDPFLDSRLFKPEEKPPIVEVEGRQHKVAIHFALRSRADYVEEVVEKIRRAHRKLPKGGILVFLTGQQEIKEVGRRLHKLLVKSGDEFMGGPRVQVSASETPTELEDLEIENVKEMENGQDDFDDIEIIADEDDEDAAEEKEFDISDNEQDDGEQQATTATTHRSATSSKIPYTSAHILPLYAQLPKHAQNLIFQPSPPDSRLIVLATNVAETSITIPNIRYVFDTGRAKRRKHNISSTSTSGADIQSFEIDYISKASASQRAGRAGRTGPGHCWRLYTSAVYEQFFPDFSEPQILTEPAESVVLMLKGINYPKPIRQFPFPTVPQLQALEMAEALLRNLGALDDQGKITVVGKELGKWPLGPRLAKCLTMAVRTGRGELVRECIRGVAGLAVGDVFVSEASAIEGSESAEVGEWQDDERDNLKQAFGRARAMFAHQDKTSDAMKLVTAVSMYEAASPSDKAAFCQDYFLRPKAMAEISELEGQLRRMVKFDCPRLAAALDGTGQPNKPGAKPRPRQKEFQQLNAIFASGYVDQVAIRADLSPSPPEIPAKPKRAIDVPYLTLVPLADRPSASLVDKAVFIHPSSVLARMPVRDLPKFVVYTHLQKSQAKTVGGETVPKTRMFPLAPADATTLVQLARDTPLLEFGKPISGGKIEELKGVPRRRECVVAVEMRVARSGFGWPLGGVRVRQVVDVKSRSGWRTDEVL
ncbi:hypothetical protein DV737_g2895, partial [Chaetothyriales sp. CBS 132003]